jgi:hypothetical protein
VKQLTFFPQPQPSFHNTIDLEGKELRKANTNAKRQEDICLQLFMDCKPRNAWEAYQELCANGETMIKDSVKRSITNLMNEGKLVKTKIKTKGEYQMSNYQYKLR